MKVFYLTNIPSPYTVDCLNRLGEKCDLTVVFERRTEEGRNDNWYVSCAETYREVYLKKAERGSAFKWPLHPALQIKRKQYDCIVISGYGSPVAIFMIIYLKMKRIPFMLSLDGAIIKEESFLKYHFKKWLISKADLLLSSGAICSQYLMHYRIQPEKIKEYPFTSLWETEILRKPPDTGDKKALREKLDIKEKNVVLAVGQFIPRKGFDLLLQAMSIIRHGDTGLYLVGGEPTEEYKKIIKDKGLTNIHFIPFKKKQELFLYYQAADVFAFPTREDIWGLVVNEAMANGLPVITTKNCVAGLELIRDQVNGYLINIENVSELAERLDRMIGDEALRQKMSEEVLVKINDYTIEKMADRLIEIFRETLGDGTEREYE